jgi:hypothetical protein
MKSNRIITTLCFFVLLFSLNACTPKSEKAIIGKWQNDNVQFEFLKDGTLISGGYAGKYALLDSSRIKLEGPRGALVCSFKINGADMEIIDPSLGPIRLKRVN